MKLPSLFFPATDKANHYVGGTIAADAGSIAGILVGLFLAQQGAPLWLVPLLGAVCAAVAAFAAGRWKEARDARQNAAAYREWLDTDQAQPFVPPHGVETADWQATTWGCVPVAVPLLVLFLISVI